MILKKSFRTQWITWRVDAMTTYAVAREVPDSCDYLTAGKRYEVSDNHDFGFSILADDGERLGPCWERSQHLNRKDWHRIETDAEGWAEWKPSKDGEAPPDWQDGWEWELLSSEGCCAKLFSYKPLWAS